MWWQNSVAQKFQASTSKLQKNSKSQAPTKSARNRNLVLGSSLDVGCWMLDLPIHGQKLQTSTSKLQKNSKSQAPTKSARNRNLVLGSSLDLGCWMLNLP